MSSDANPVSGYPVRMHVPLQSRRRKRSFVRKIIFFRSGYGDDHEFTPKNHMKYCY